MEHWGMFTTNPITGITYYHGEPKKHYITEESFGSELPENWEEIANELNRIIDERGIADDELAVNELWDEWWNI